MMTDMGISERCMTSQLIPPPDLAPPVPDNLTAEQRIALWAEVLDACEELLLAGLRREVGPDGDVHAAYRQWHTQQMESHDDMIRRMLLNLHRRESGHGG
jgi:hypothetical protein